MALSAKQIEELKDILNLQKTKILNNQSFKNLEDIQTPADEIKEDTDLASTIISQQLSFSMRDRDLMKLRLINMALERIENGEYGLCEDCGEEIEMKRLRNQPWTDVCIVHAEEREKERSGALRRIG